VFALVFDDVRKPRFVYTKFSQVEAATQGYSVWIVCTKLWLALIRYFSLMYFDLMMAQLLSAQSSAMEIRGPISPSASVSCLGMPCVHVRFHSLLKYLQGRSEGGGREWVRGEGRGEGGRVHCVARV
jgi:hypothetical protein